MWRGHSCPQLLTLSCVAAELAPLGQPANSQIVASLPQIRRPAIGDEFITIARVLKTQGRRGEIAVEPRTSHPDRFVPGLRMFVLGKEALGKETQRREVELEDLWPHKGYLVLKLKGVDSMNDAETFLQCELQIPLKERAQLEPGAAYISDMVGCEVTDHGKKIGTVTDVQFGAGEAPLLVVKDAGTEKIREHLLPLAEVFLEGGAAGIDVVHKQIRMNLPEGLLEINSPLTPEEKEAQRTMNQEE